MQCNDICDSIRFGCAANIVIQPAQQQKYPPLQHTKHNNIGEDSEIIPPEKIQRHLAQTHAFVHSQGNLVIFYQHLSDFWYFPPI